MIDVHVVTSSNCALYAAELDSFSDGGTGIYVDERRWRESTLDGASVISLTPRWQRTCSGLTRANSWRLPA